MTDALEDSKLLLEKLCKHWSFLHLIFVDDFKRTNLVGAQVYRLIYFAINTCTDHLLKLVELLYIFDFVKAFEGTTEC